MSIPPVGVVIPAFNAAATVQRAIRSVLAHPKLVGEIVVVDDGSTDDTAVAASIDPSRVLVIRQENGGSSVARQTGTAALSTEYVAYLDADDWWLPERESRLHSIIEQCAPSFVFGNFIRAAMGSDGPVEYFPENTSFFPSQFSQLKSYSARSALLELYDVEGGDMRSLLLDGFPPYPSTMLCRRSDVVAIGGWDSRFRRAQDFDFALRMASGRRVHFDNSVTTVVGLHSANSDRDSYVIKQLNGDLAVIRAHLDSETSAVGRAELSSALQRRLTRLGWELGNVGRFAEAAAAYASAAGMGGGLYVHARTRQWYMLSRSLIRDVFRGDQ